METFLVFCELACGITNTVLLLASLWASLPSETKASRLMRALRLNRAALIAAGLGVGVIATELIFGFWTWTWILWVVNIVATLIARHFLGIRWHLLAGGR